MTVALAERIEAVLTPGRPLSPRAIHRVLKGRPERINEALADLVAAGVVKMQVAPSGRRLYSLVPKAEVTAIRRGARLFAAILNAGTLTRSAAYGPASAATAAELDAVIARLVAEGRITEDDAGRLRPADVAVSPPAEHLLAVIRSRGEDGLAPDECDTALDGEDARPTLGELVRAGVVVRHGDEFPWFVATEHSMPDLGPESPNWNLGAKSAFVWRRLAALGPQSEDALTAAAARDGLELRPGDVGRVALDIGLCEVNGLWRDDVLATNQQKIIRRICLNDSAEDTFLADLL